MNIYLPMKNDLLDKGEGTIWTGGGLKEPEIVKFNGVKCAKFDGNSRLRLQDTTPIKSLKEWTIQAWIYPTKVGYKSYVATNVLVGGASIADKFGISVNSIDTIQMYNIGTFSSLSVLNRWHHFKIVGNDVSLSGYFDGNLLGKSDKNPISFNFSTFTLGDVNNDSGRDTKFYGYMTQFKFSDKYNDEDLSLIGSKFIYINKNNEVWAMV